MATTREDIAGWLERGKREGATHVIIAVLALSFFGCEASPPAPPPEPDHLAADIAQLNADFLACMRRENDRLREEKAALDAKIAAKVVEAEDLAKTLSKTPKGRR